MFAITGITPAKLVERSRATFWPVPARPSCGARPPKRRTWAQLGCDLVRADIMMLGAHVSIQRGRKCVSCSFPPT